MLQVRASPPRGPCLCHPPPYVRVVCTHQRAPTSSRGTNSTIPLLNSLFHTTSHFQCTLFFCRPGFVVNHLYSCCSDVQRLLGQAGQLLDRDYAEYASRLQDPVQQCRRTCQQLRKQHLPYIGQVSQLNAALHSQSQQQRRKGLTAAVSAGGIGGRAAVSEGRGQERLTAISRLGEVPAAMPRPLSPTHITWRYPPSGVDAAATEAGQGRGQRRQGSDSEGGATAAATEAGSGREQPRQGRGGYSGGGAAVAAAEAGQGQLLHQQQRRRKLGQEGYAAVEGGMERGR